MKYIQKVLLHCHHISTVNTLELGKEDIHMHRIRNKKHVG